MRELYPPDVRFRIISEYMWKHTQNAKCCRKLDDHMINAVTYPFKIEVQ
jgi:hypothetical protein